MPKLVKIVHNVCDDGVCYIPLYSSDNYLAEPFDSREGAEESAILALIDAYNESAKIRS